MFNYTKNERGFTLIELLVVIAIIGTLASVVLASLNSAREAARDTKRLADMEEVTKALQLYWLENDATYPGNASHADCGGAGACLPAMVNTHLSSYLSSAPQDPTEIGETTNYRYQRCAGNNTYSILIYNETGDGRCNIKHQANYTNTTNANSCWTLPNSSNPQYGWCDDEM